MGSPVSTASAIMQVLLRGEGYGAELVERVKTLTKGRIQIAQGALHPALQRLIDDGSAKFRVDEAAMKTQGGLPRHYYSLTKRGARRAREEAEIVRELFGEPPAEAEPAAEVEGDGEAS